MDKWTYDRRIVGERIRRRRMELNITQAQLAEQIGKSTKYCADVERGSCGMAVEALLDFCYALRLSPSVVLLGDAAPFTQENNVEQQIIQCISECTEEQQRGILEIIRLFTSRI